MRTGHTTRVENPKTHQNGYMLVYLMKTVCLALPPHKHAHTRRMTENDTQQNNTNGRPRVPAPPAPSAVPSLLPKPGPLRRFLPPATPPPAAGRGAQARHGTARHARHGRRHHLVPFHFLKWMIRENLSPTSEAPPTSAPSMSGCAMSSSTVSGVTEPPYWMMVLAATSSP